MTDGRGIPAEALSVQSELVAQLAASLGALAVHLRGVASETQVSNNLLADLRQSTVTLLDSTIRYLDLHWREMSEQEIIDAYVQLLESINNILGLEQVGQQYASGNIDIDVNDMLGDQHANCEQIKVDIANNIAVLRIGGLILRIPRSNNAGEFEIGVHDGVQNARVAVYKNEKNGPTLCVDVWSEDEKNLLYGLNISDYVYIADKAKIVEVLTKRVKHLNADVQDKEKLEEYERLKGAIIALSQSNQFAYLKAVIESFDGEKLYGACEQRAYMVKLAKEKVRANYRKEQVKIETDKFKDALVEWAKVAMYQLEPEHFIRKFLLLISITGAEDSNAIDLKVSDL